MIRRIAALALISLLCACGGGGGTPGSSSIPTVPNSPEKLPGHATFSFRLPGKNTMSRVRRPLYVSQGTLGVAIDWTSTDPTHPDYAAPVSATCPSSYPIGVTACSLDGNGDTDYTFSLPIPVGTYTFTVSTYDQQPGGTLPSAGTFLTPAHMLAQGQLAAPVTIVAGQTNSVNSLTFYGVPTSVSFVPGPAQSHVTPATGGYAIIGNAPQTFYVQASDADGYAISSHDTGAPTIATTTTYPTYLTITPVAANSLTISVIGASSATTPTVSVTATSNGTGLPSVSSTFNIQTIEELWMTESAGGISTDYGLRGYALYPPTYFAMYPLDFTYDIPSGPCGSGVQCQFQPTAAGPGGIFVSKAAQSNLLYEFTAAVGTKPPALPASALGITTASFSNVAFDSGGHMFYTDNTNGTLVAIASPTSTSIVAMQPSLSGVSGLTVAPSSPNATLPTALQETVWVGDTNATPVSAFAPYPSLNPIPVTFAGGSMSPPSSVVAVGFDSYGQLWLSDGTNMYVYSVSGSLSGITLTPLLAASSSPAAVPAAGSSFGAALNGYMWIGNFANGNYDYAYSLSTEPCTAPPCTITNSTSANTSSPVDGSIVVP